jgi:hypothetical protein
MLGTDDGPGIMVQTLNELFMEMEKTKQDIMYSVSMSYLEVSIYSKHQIQHKMKKNTLTT